MIDLKKVVQNAIVIHPVTASSKSQFADYDLEEAVRLCEALEVNVVANEIIPVREIRAGEYFGKGKIADIKAMVSANDADIVVVNNSLAPIQQRNLEKIWNAKVIDRTGMILEIFALRAATKEGKLQVELARQAYERSRLVRTWTHLERQRGGQGFLAGPGETQIESDRRMLDMRIGKLKRQIDDVSRTRALQRVQRQRAPERVVALVGYTNAGKSTIFNRLTTGGVLAKDMLFATLDTTHRVLPLPSGKSAVLSDTVGFISDLPTDLITAFRATLEEVKEADLILHVRDAGDPLAERRRKDVMDILNSLEAGPKHGQPIIEVLNKADLVSAEERGVLIERAAASRDQDSVTDVYVVSALTGMNIDALMDGVEATLSAADEVLNFDIPPKDYAIRAWLHTHGEVLSEDVSDQGHSLLEVKLPSIEAGIAGARYKKFLAKAS